MKFKVDENLPKEVAGILTLAGYDALTVLDQQMGGVSDLRIAEVCKQENRVIITTDLDFSDIRTYPPEDFPGIMVFRLNSQEKKAILETIERLLPVLDQSEIKNRLWIVEADRIRIRQ